MHYRQVWEQANGPIPVGHEIHHIDGDRNNNEISNLMCVTTQEHYDIHYSQGDWGACTLLARRLKHLPEDLHDLQSKVAKENCKKQIDNGTWHLTREGPHEQKRLEGLRNSSKHKKHLEGLNQRVLEAGNHTSQRKGTCVHCGKTMDIANLGKYHNDNCKSKI